MITSSSNEILTKNNKNENNEKKIIGVNKF